MTAKSLRRFRGALMPTASHPAIRSIKRRSAQPEIHGNKLWKSSCLVIDYLHRNPPTDIATVVDVGCGWGIGGVWCAQHLGADVTSVDADPNVFPYLDVVAGLNGVETHHLTRRFEQLTTRQLGRYDLMLGADICFWDDLVKPVYNMVNRAIRAGVGQIILADPERPTFMQMAERVIDRHGGELCEWRTRGPLSARGVLLIIENR
ncbi:MAG: methyltransferase [Chromatocurvus sp.]